MHHGALPPFVDSKRWTTLGPWRAVRLSDMGLAHRVALFTVYPFGEAPERWCVRGAVVDLYLSQPIAFASMPIDGPTV